MVNVELDAHRWRKLLALIHSGEVFLGRDDMSSCDQFGYSTKTEYFDGYFDVAALVDAVSDKYIDIMEKAYKNDFTSTEPNN